MHKTSRPALLHDLLSAIVKSYGREAVTAALHDLERPAATPASRAEDKKDSRKKPTAVEILTRLDLGKEDASLLVKLADLYDQRRFLATAGDARLFFSLQGMKDPMPKERSEIFRKIAPHLLGMSAPALRSLIDESEHAGPSELGPLSDAIKASSAVLRPTPKADPPPELDNAAEKAAPVVRTPEDGK